MRFMIKDQGGVNADVFIAFLQRLLAGAGRTIFPAADRGPAQIARKTRAFVESLNGSPRLFYLPPCSPDRNQDALAWKPRTAGTVGRTAITRKNAFKTKVRSSLRRLPTRPEKSPPSTKNLASNPPRESLVMYELSNTLRSPTFVTSQHVDDITPFGVRPSNLAGRNRRDYL